MSGGIDEIRGRADDRNEGNVIRHLEQRQFVPVAGLDEGRRRPGVQHPGAKPHCAHALAAKPRHIGLGVIGVPLGAGGVPCGWVELSAGGQQEVAAVQERRGIGEI